MRLNDMIRERRLSLGLSQYKLAKMLGYPEAQFISNIERARASFPRRKLKRLCRALLLDRAVVRGILIAEATREIDISLGF